MHFRTGLSINIFKPDKMTHFRAVGDNLPGKPSEVGGYWPITSDSRLPAIRQRALLAKILLIVIPTLTVATFFVEGWPDWITQIEKVSPIGSDWLLLALLLTAFGVTVACFNYTFGGWQKERELIWREVQDGNIAVVAQSICHLICPGGTWQWYRPGSWGDGYLVILSNGSLVLVNLTTDWIGYGGRGGVSEVQYSCRRIGSATESRTQAQAYAGGYYGYAAYTNAQTSAQTRDYYEHIIDIYSNFPGNEHIHANFGSNESLAKEAYAKLLPLAQSHT